MDVYVLRVWDPGITKLPILITRCFRVFLGLLEFSVQGL